MSLLAIGPWISQNSPKLPNILHVLVRTATGTESLSAQTKHSRSGTVEPSLYQHLVHGNSGEDDTALSPKFLAKHLLKVEEEWINVLVLLCIDPHLLLLTLNILSMATSDPSMRGLWPLTAMTKRWILSQLLMSLSTNSAMILVSVSLSGSSNPMVSISETSLSVLP